MQNVVPRALHKTGSVCAWLRLSTHHTLQAKEWKPVCLLQAMNLLHPGQLQLLRQTAQQLQMAQKLQVPLQGLPVGQPCLEPAVKSACVAMC